MAELQPGLEFDRKWSRRSLLAAVPAAVCVPATRGDAGSQVPSLRRIAAGGGLRFGAAMRVDALSDPILRDLLIAECTTLTPELEFKWAAIAPGADRQDYAPADRIAAFARAGAFRIRGHALLWHGSVPEWAQVDLARDGGWAIVAAHIRALVTRYADVVDEWDVINEPIEPGARPDGLRQNAFLAAFGRDYIARALLEAHAAAPRARLLINEYGLEYPVAEHQARRDALLALARSLVEQGVPLHGVGIQAHLDLNKGPLDTGVLRRFVAAIGALGLSVVITELDVKEAGYILPAAQRDRLVAAHVTQFLTAVLPDRAVTSLSCWGLSDRQSWLAVTPADRARFPGAWADGSTPGLNRGLPFDGAGKPKPMRQAIAAALARPRG